MTTLFATIVIVGTLLATFALALAGANVRTRTPAEQAADDAEQARAINLKA
jgi:hypothetical protein